MNKLSASQIRELLNLEPHPIEGGYLPGPTNRRTKSRYRPSRLASLPRA